MKVLFDWKVAFICKGIKYESGHEYDVDEALVKRYSAMFKILDDKHICDAKCDHDDKDHKCDDACEHMLKLEELKKLEGIKKAKELKDKKDK